VTVPSSWKALTIRQPWASLICPGPGIAPVKTIETARPKWSYRGPVLIHAGKEWAPGWRGRWFSRGDIEGTPGRILETVGVLDELAEDINGSGYYRLDRYAQRAVPLGAVIGVARITDCLPVLDQDEAIAADLADLPYPRIESSVSGVLWLFHPTLGDPIDPEDGCSDISDQEPYGDFSPGTHALLLDDIVSLPRPIPATGRQGHDVVDAELVAAVEAQIGDLW